MKFFIDTANLAQIKVANELGILDGRSSAGLKSYVGFAE